jgi:hypothetical protein
MTKEQIEEIENLKFEALRLSKASLETVMDLGLLDMTKLEEAKAKIRTQDERTKFFVSECLKAGTESAFFICREVLLDVITMENQGIAAYKLMAISVAKARNQVVAQKGMMN